MFAHLPRSKASVALLSCALLGCERGDPPLSTPSTLGSPPEVTLRVGGGARAARAEDPAQPASGSVAAPAQTADDQLPFTPSGMQLASIAWRTWIYTDVGSKRTRLGYLRAGQIVDARGPAIFNDGCEGGWWRINPRGFVCVGKGATLDLKHPLVRALGQRATRGKGFPYHYAKSKSRPPERYFRLPTRAQMIEVEGKDVIDRGAAFALFAERTNLAQRWDIAAQPPAFLADGQSLDKPYGTKSPLRWQVHAGRASSDSGFALLESFSHNGRAFGLSSELDLLALDRLDLVEELPSFALHFTPEQSLPVAFIVEGATTLWTRNERGMFVAAGEQRARRGYFLTGGRAPGGMVETSEGVWLAAQSVRLIEPRSSYPSVATGTRKWIDVSIGKQTLIAYEGQRPVFATLISTGRGGLGDEGESDPQGEKTVRGTFMIYEKSVSSTMDGDEDRADSYELQDVPFVQYFHRGFALHGAYWHDDFGRKRSHGCINLAPYDAAWLFEWTDPEVPADWHSALNKQRGTVVHVRY